MITMGPGCVTSIRLTPGDGEIRLLSQGSTSSVSRHFSYSDTQLTYFPRLNDPSVPLLILGQRESGRELANVKFRRSLNAWWLAARFVSAFAVPFTMAILFFSPITQGRNEAQISFLAADAALELAILLGIPDFVTTEVEGDALLGNSTEKGH